MQPIDPLSQLALCCGLGGRRNREYKNSRHFFYSPSTAHFDGANSWTLATNPYAPQPQPYFLLTQPVIIAGNPATSQTNTMTLVQHAQTAPNGSPFPTISFMAPPIGGPNQQHIMQPSIVSSQYAIYNSSAALNTSFMAPTTPAHTQPNPAASIYDTQPTMNYPSYLMNKRQPTMQSMLEPAVAVRSATSQMLSSVEKPNAVTLDSEIFRKLELVERQVDLSRDMDLIEKLGIVITRALEPNSLMPHLTEATFRRYHERFLFNNDNYVIRFIEIIKRPGQTLGLYIRTVQFEDPQSHSSRPGLVITKIDTDSPIYNSQVLHVGDEILSVNLVDVQGMSLDDVVIIMSIPRRLVLALRITKDRDQLLSMNLIQQQQAIKDNQRRELAAQMYNQRVQAATMASSLRKDPIERPSSSRPFSAQLQENRADFGLPFEDFPQVDELHAELSSKRNFYSQETNENFQPSNLASSSPTTAIKQPIISNLRLGDTPEQSSYFSSSIDAINRELKELRRQRMALSANEQQPAPP